ncbi:hypothetical protein BJ912DRAFT_932274 [Pholiota molesta]|nr:hypothetical protein BJ912DRAFT_932274 [Pholiota molesta]
MSPTGSSRKMVKRTANCAAHLSPSAEHQLTARNEYLKQQAHHKRYAIAQAAVKSGAKCIVMGGLACRARSLSTKPARSGELRMPTRLCCAGRACDAAQQPAPAPAPLQLVGYYSHGTPRFAVVKFGTLIELTDEGKLPRITFCPHPTRSMFSGLHLIYPMLYSPLQNARPHHRPI